MPSSLNTTDTAHDTAEDTAAALLRAFACADRRYRPSGRGSLLPSPWPYLGAVPIGIGVLIAAQGSRLFAKAGTNIIPFTESSALVTSGVFSFSRNPMYTGMVLALAGTALVMNGLYAWLVVIAFTAIIRALFIRNEETLMEQTFGEEYLAYKASVRRWI